MRTYLHKVQYYETDQMGFVHHSNYIRWFEEARIDFMTKIGLDYQKLEEQGCLSPVLSVNCQYRKSVKFGETVQIVTRLLEFGNVKFKLSYQVLDSETGELRAEGESTHCFINPQGKPISLKRQNPQAFEIFRSAL